MEANIRHTARLARLAVSEEDVRRLTPQFERILAAFEELAALELQAGDDSDRPWNEALLPRATRLRADEEQTSLALDELLRHAPEAHAGFYGVPKTVESPASNRSDEPEGRDASSDATSPPGE